MTKILIAGATGLVGYEVLKLCHNAGHTIRTLSRDATRALRLRAYATEVMIADATQEGALHGICDSIEVVISTLGATVSQSAAERRSFAAIDTAANLALIGEAKRAGVRRFVYLSALHDASTAGTAYIQAHHAVEEALGRSDISTTIIRPTGIFGAFLELAEMARRGPLPVIGRGDARTNPVHELDVAEAILRAVENGPGIIEIGGPAIYTRHEIVRLIFQDLGVAPRIIRVPRWVIAGVATILGCVNRRSADFIRFVIAASTHDALAPTTGTRLLGDYLRANREPARSV